MENICGENICGEGNENVRDDGQMSLFPEERPKKPKQPEQKPASPPKPSEPKFAEKKKLNIIYAGQEIELEPEDEFADEKTLWEKYLKNEFPEFRYFDQIAFNLGKEEQKTTVFPIPKAQKMG